MSDYIKREDAIQANVSQVEFCKSEGLDFSGKLHIDSIINNLKHIPAADVVERKHGKWKELTRYGLNSQRAICECSVCGGNAWVYDDEKRRFKYCPNCGAKMDGES